MNIENKRTASILSSKDDSHLTHSHSTGDLKYYGASQNQLNRYSSEFFTDENDYKDTDPELSVLIKRPQIIPQQGLTSFDSKPIFQRPVKCSRCKKFVIRDPSVVDNHVVCPSCENQFCWICLGQAKDNHFDDTNLNQCPGKQYKDMRSRKKLCGEACQRITLTLKMPWLNIYYCLSSMFQKVNGCGCYQKRNCFLRILTQTIVTMILTPLILLIGFIGGLLSGFVSFFCQLGKITQICCRSRRLAKKKKQQQSSTRDTQIEGGSRSSGLNLLDSHKLETQVQVEKLLDQSIKDSHHSFSHNNSESTQDVTVTTSQLQAALAQGHEDELFRLPTFGWSPVSAQAKAVDLTQESIK